MIIHCPICTTNFLLEGKAVKKKHRFLKCGNCGYVWDNNAKERRAPDLINALIYLFFAAIVLLSIEHYIH